MQTADRDVETRDPRSREGIQESNCQPRDKVSRAMGQYFITFFSNIYFTDDSNCRLNIYVYLQVIARQHERRLEESKAEAGQLRNRLTMIEKNLNDTDPEAKLHRKCSQRNLKILHQSWAALHVRGTCLVLQVLS